MGTVDFRLMMTKRKVRASSDHLGSNLLIESEEYDLACDLSLIRA